MIVQAAKKTSLKLALLVCIWGVSACTYTPQRTSKPQLVAEPDSVSLMLADAAGKAAKSLETLASIEQYRTPQGGISTIPNAPAELRRGMSVQWVGPAEPLIKAIADKASYQYVVLGDTPPAPIVISIDAQNKQIIDVLRDVGLQMGHRADLKVDGARRVIELQYAPAIGAQKF